MPVSERQAVEAYVAAFGVDRRHAGSDWNLVALRRARDTREQVDIVERILGHASSSSAGCASIDAVSCWRPDR